MRAVEILKEEHRVLRTVLHCLDRLVQEGIRDERIDGEAAGRTLEFLERFADGCHQDKEEDVLFPRLLDKTSDIVLGSVRELLRVHETERELLDELRTQFEGAAYGDYCSLGAFLGHARDYVALQRRHADAEDSHLFPLAEEFLDGSDDAEIVEGFGRVDREYVRLGGPGPERLAAQLCARFGVDAEAEPCSALHVVG